MKVLLICMLVKGATLSPDPLITDRIISIEKEENFLRMVKFRKSVSAQTSVNRMRQNVVSEFYVGGRLARVTLPTGDTYFTRTKDVICNKD